LNRSISDEVRNNGKNDLAGFAADRPYRDGNRRGKAQDWPIVPRLGKQRSMSGLDTEVIVVGEELKPEGAVNKIQKKLDRDKIDFVVGPIFSNVLLAIDKPVTGLEDLYL
jgi:hypothetical protein